MKLFNVKINVDLCKKNVGFSFLMKCGKCVHKGCCKIKLHKKVPLIRKCVYAESLSGSSVQLNSKKNSKNVDFSLCVKLLWLPKIALFFGIFWITL